MQRIVSGIQSSGKLTLGNYLGAIKNFVKLQNDYETYIFVANLHSITVEQNKKELLENTRNLVAFYLAAGLDYEKTTIFLQSEVPAHSQLAWILQCHTYMGELSRMTQFKDKSSNQGENIRVGLFTYPVLMAADILLYDAAYVPVGEDQKQHLELTRDLAMRFNNIYPDTFVIPQPYIAESGAKIMSLTDPTKKMSKSDKSGDKACIYLLDDEKTVYKKIKSATTDMIGKINYDPVNQPGISNLLTIYSLLEEKTIAKAVKEFKDTGYAEFKEAVAYSISNHLKQLQEKYQEIIKENLVEKALEIGKVKANEITYKKIRKIQQKIGLSFKK